MDMLWNLDALYTSFDSQAYQADKQQFEKSIEDMVLWSQENLTNFSDPVLKMEQYIQKQNEMSRFFNLFSYAHLVLAVDSNNETALKMVDILSDKLTALKKPEVQFIAFVGHFGNLEELILQSPILTEHKFILLEEKEKSRYMLSEKEETLCAKMVNTGSSAWSNLKNMLMATLMVDIRLDGENKQLPLSVVRNLYFDKDQNTRKTAYHAELDSYQKIDKAVAFCLNSIKGEAITQCQLRGYNSVLDMTLKNSRMKPKTLSAMMEAISQVLPALRRFYYKKAQLLNHKNGLPFYDMFAPVGEVSMRFSYEEAATFVIKNFYTFGKELGDYAKQAFEEQWIDAKMREGKRGGAFCYNLHSISQSRIMTNFSGSFSDVTTLAHELGHGYHGHCLQKASYLNSHYPMPIAETASTFCETIVCNAALSQATKEEKLVILQNQLSDMLQVIVDIYGRFQFESRLFEKREKGSLSVSEINDLMIQSQKEAYGDAIDNNFLHAGMWINKPHYYTASRNFYNFPYAYGLLFALGLYAQYQKTGEAFVPTYNALLAASGCHSLEDTALLCHIDVTKKTFWETSLAFITEQVETFCAM